VDKSRILEEHFRTVRVLYHLLIVVICAIFYIIIHPDRIKQLDQALQEINTLKLVEPMFYKNILELHTESDR
jgi:hypothetical protein